MPVLSVVLFGAALWFVHRESAQLHLRDVLHQARGMQPNVLWAALGLTGLSYWLLGFYDVLGLRYVKRGLPYAQVAFVSFIAFAFGHNISLAGLTGTGVRYRLYSSMGFGATEVAMLSGFISLTAVAGLAMLSGVALLAKPAVFASVLHVAPAVAQALGGVLLALLLAYAAWALVWPKNVSVRGWSVGPPSPGLLIQQLLLAVIDLALSASVLWVLLPPDANVGMLAFVGVYALAVIAGLVSNVPGGLGVFEAMILIGLPHARAESVLASLLIYRAIYYFVPLVAATLLFAVKELNAQRSRIVSIGRASGAYVAPLVPQITSVLTFIAGAVLLVSGFTPSLDAQLSVLGQALALPWLELSHLAGSIIGVALLIVSRSLMQRVGAARHIASWLLAVGIAVALLRGPDIAAAGTLALVLVVLRIGRTAFYRPASLLDESFTPAWVVSIAGVLIATIWLGFFAHRHIEYANSLWWTFAIHGDAPRMLRASFVVVLLAASYFATNLLRPSPSVPCFTSQSDLARARKILVHEDHTLGQVALAGDKRLLFSDADDAFLMYQVIGRSWIALGDSVGRPERDEELAWRFRELSDRHAGRTAFYQVRPERLPVYIDLGLVPLKLGEEARVPLAQFKLEGSARAGLRQSHRRAEREGLTFEVAQQPMAMQHLNELARVSSAWLATKNTAEKHFSIGAFSPAYLANFPIALIRRGDMLVAFANLWASATTEELSVDLMRFAPEAPHGTMDYLFVELLLWAQQQGYRWFNLGMAPLAGLGLHPLASRWHQVGGFVFRHGEHFYNFQGLRRYKAKFGPIWEPRYLATTGGLALPRILMDTSLLISGGIRGLLSK